ncbi:hypothetical protein XENTR_v10010616 [Xenopus tropicalis]|nr:hypothetical protein XENTR_v10010616 [Xenopus tropicalis]
MFTHCLHLAPLSSCFPNVSILPYDLQIVLLLPSCSTLSIFSYCCLLSGCYIALLPPSCPTTLSCPIVILNYSLQVVTIQSYCHHCFTVFILSYCRHLSKCYHNVLLPPSCVTLPTIPHSAFLQLLHFGVYLFI